MLRGSLCPLHRAIHETHETHEIKRPLICGRYFFKRTASHKVEIIITGVQITLSGGEVVGEKDYSIGPHLPGHIDLFDC